MMVLPQLSERLRQFRESHGLTFKEFAAQIAGRHLGPAIDSKRLEELEQGAMPTVHETFVLEFLISCQSRT